MNRIIWRCCLTALGLLTSSLAWSETISAQVYTTANHTPIGKVIFTDTKYGLLIEPKLNSLNPGLHGFHIHQHPSCKHSGMAAAGHLDPKKTNNHLGPYKAGHLGDLPALYVDQSGSATTVVLAPRLKVADIKSHSVMIHEGGDNYSDKPLPLGGGGARTACAKIR